MRLLWSCLILAALAPGLAWAGSCQERCQDRLVKCSQCSDPEKCMARCSEEFTACTDECGPSDTSKLKCYDKKGRHRSCDSLDPQLPAKSPSPPEVPGR